MHYMSYKNTNLEICSVMIENSMVYVVYIQNRAKTKERFNEDNVTCKCV